MFGGLETSDVVLNHPSISRRHAAMAHDADGVLYVIDLGSTHGTFLDGTRLRAQKRTCVQQGSTVRFGASTRKYVVDVGQEEHATSAAPAPAAAAAPVVVEEPPKESAEQWAARKQREAYSKVHGGGSSAAVAASAGNDKDPQHLQHNIEVAEVNDEEEEATEEDPLATEERKRKRTEQNRAKREAKKQAKKQKWADMKHAQKSAKFRKKNWVPKDKTENERLANICGQPTW